MTGMNVFVLVLDSMRKDRLSVYNDDVDFTPNIERIASESKIYRNSNAQGPWTLPSTASIFTGQYPWEHNATHNNTRLETDRELLVEKFRDENYDTKLITSNTWLSPSTGMTRGFHEVENHFGLAGNQHFQNLVSKLGKLYDRLGENTREKIAHVLNLGAELFMDLEKSRKTVDEAKKFLEEKTDKEKFFLFVNLMSAHEPYDPGDPPEEYMKDQGVEKPSEIPRTDREYFKSKGKKDELRKAYDAAVDYTDDLVGELYDKLAEQDLEEDTLLVVLGDHGQAVGKNGILGHQFTVMNEVVEVPLIISDPSSDDQKDKENLFELKDLYTKIPKLAGIKDSGPANRDLIRGGYEFPEFVSESIPEERKSELDRKLLYARNSNGKIVKKISRNGDAEYEYTGDKDRELKKVVDSVEENKSVSGDEIEDEAVKKRLEKLGYT